jgi:hypothetical protein
MIYLILILIVFVFILLLFVVKLQNKVGELENRLDDELALKYDEYVDRRTQPSPPTEQLGSEFNPKEMAKKVADELRKEWENKFEESTDNFDEMEELDVDEINKSKIVDHEGDPEPDPSHVLTDEEQKNIERLKKNLIEDIDLPKKNEDVPPTPTPNTIISTKNEKNDSSLEGNIHIPTLNRKYDGSKQY